MHADGHELEGGPQDPIPPLPSNGQFDARVHLLAPMNPGTYATNWRLACSSGYFGDPVWVIIHVHDEPSNLLLADAAAGLNQMSMESSDTMDL